MPHNSMNGVDPQFNPLVAKAVKGRSTGTANLSSKSESRLSTAPPTSPEPGTTATGEDNENSTLMPSKPGLMDRWHGYWMCDSFPKASTGVSFLVDLSASWGFLGFLLATGLKAADFRGQSVHIWFLVLAAGAVVLNIYLASGVRRGNHKLVMAKLGFFLSGVLAVLGVGLIAANFGFGGVSIHFWMILSTLMVVILTIALTMEVYRVTNCKKECCVWQSGQIFSRERFAYIVMSLVLYAAIHSYTMWIYVYVGKTNAQYNGATVDMKDYLNALTDRGLRTNGMESFTEHRYSTVLDIALSWFVFSIAAMVMSRYDVWRFLPLRAKSPSTSSSDPMVATP
jgi:hypothetical protein